MPLFFGSICKSKIKLFLNKKNFKNTKKKPFLTQTFGSVWVWVGFGSDPVGLTLDPGFFGSICMVPGFKMGATPDFYGYRVWVWVWVWDPYPYPKPYFFRVAMYVKEWSQMLFKKTTGLFVLFKHEIFTLTTMSF